MTLSRWLHSALDPAHAGDDPRLEQRLLELLMAGRAAHPGVVASEETFVRMLARGLRGGGDLVEQLGARLAGDVWLVAGCLGRDPAAVRAFEQILVSEIAKARSKMTTALDADDLKQSVWQKLFVPDEGQPPKALEYSGEGSLRGWLRVVLVRTSVDAGRKLSGQERVVDDGARADALFSATSDPELDYLKRHYRGAFEAAFIDALAAIDAEDRVALRQHFVDKLSIDQLALVLGVHRATAARRVQRAREALLAGTRQRLMGSLGLSRVELESVMRMIESQLHVSVVRLLG